MTTRPVARRRRRAPSFAVARLRRERRDFLRQNGWGLAGMVLLVAVSFLPTMLLRRDFINGVLLGVCLGTLICVFYFVVAIRSYSAYIGAKAERWTDQLLKKYAPDGWRWVTNVPFENYDVDCVVVTPGAVLAVEVKWHSYLSPKEQPKRHRSDLEQAMYSAGKIKSFLRSVEMHHLPVLPVLIMWGPGIPDMTGGRAIEDDVHILDGNQHSRWLRHYDTGYATLDLRDELHQRLHAHITRVETAREQARDVRRNAHAVL